MIINGKDLIMGRMATVVAKKALDGERVDIINCEGVVVSGHPKTVAAHYKRRSDMGTPAKGPFIPKRPDLFVKRAIRGMLPYKREKGKNAYNKIRCYIGIPESLKDQKSESIERANKSKLPDARFAKVIDICLNLGYKSK